MKRFSFVLVAMLVATATPVLAAKPPPDTYQLTLAAGSSTVTFGNSTKLSGRLTGDSPVAGQEVKLQSDGFPFDGFKQTATTTTDTAGTYKFTVTPALNTMYRATVKSKPPATSPQVLVKVRMKVSLRVSDSSVDAGDLVSFRGSVKPQHDGNVVDIQKRRHDGSYKTIAHARLKDAGDTRSRYSRRVRIRRGGVYRVKATSDGDHASGVSRRRRISTG